MRQSHRRRGRPFGPRAERTDPSAVVFDDGPLARDADDAVDPERFFEEDPVLDLRDHQPEGKRDLNKRLISATAVAAVVIAAMVAGPAATAVVIALAVTTSLSELFALLRRRGHHPATPVAMLGAAGAVAASYLRGPAGLQLVVVATSVAVFGWYLAGGSRGSVVTNAGLSFAGFAWIGVFGSYAALLASPATFSGHQGIYYFLGALLCTIAYDTGAYAVGRRFGKRVLAGSISPHKTLEGAFGGTVSSVLMGAVVVSGIPPWTLSQAAALGVVVAVAAPVGDLFESLVKRDLKVKDMSSLLPGHGGMLDRIDALLFVLPATYYLLVAMHAG